MADEKNGKMKALIQTAITAFAVLAAVVSMTYSITTGSALKRLDIIDTKVNELREGRVLTGNQIAELSKAIDKLDAAIQKHLEKR